MTYPVAEAWKRANPRAYRRVVEWAYEDQDHGVRPAIDLYVNLLRRPHFARKLGFKRTDREYLFNNTLRSELARLIKSEYPDLGFELRKSKHDEQGVYATPFIRRAV
jgi:hypothetical protein